MYTVGDVRADRKAHPAQGAAEEGSAGQAIYVVITPNRNLLTPPLRLGLLPGVLRRSLIDSGRALEAELTLDDCASEFLIGNALRGLHPALFQ